MSNKLLGFIKKLSLFFRDYVVRSSDFHVGWTTWISLTLVAQRDPISAAADRSGNREYSCSARPPCRRGASLCAPLARFAPRPSASRHGWPVCRSASPPGENLLTHFTSSGRGSCRYTPDASGAVGGEGNMIIAFRWAA